MERRLDLLRKAGVTFRCDTKVGRDISLSTLRNSLTQSIWLTVRKNRSRLIFPVLNPTAFFTGYRF